MINIWNGFVIFFYVYLILIIFYFSFRIYVWLIFDKKISHRIEQIDNMLNECSEIPFVFVWKMFKKSQENMFCRLFVVPIFSRSILVFVLLAVLLIFGFVLYIIFGFSFVSYLLLVNFKDYVVNGKNVENKS